MKQVWSQLACAVGLVRPYSALAGSHLVARVASGLFFRPTIEEGEKTARQRPRMPTGGEIAAGADGSFEDGGGFESPQGGLQLPSPSAGARASGLANSANPLRSQA